MVAITVWTLIIYETISISEIEVDSKQTVLTRETGLPPAGSQYVHCTLHNHHRVVSVRG